MDTGLLVTYIRNHIELSDDEVEILLSKIICRKYLKGQFLVQQGDICKYSGFMLSGCSKTFHSDDEGQEHILMFSIESWWSGDIGSYISQTPSDYSVQFIENSDVALFPKETSEELFRLIPSLERFFRFTAERGLVAAQKRIVRGFSMNAKEQYKYFRTQYPLIEQRIPQYMVASYLGITKEFLSKIKSQVAHEI